MRVLLVEEEAGLAAIWSDCLRRFGAEVTVVDSQELAIRFLQSSFAEVVILNLGLSQGSSLAVADFASYRHPTTKIIPVTSNSFFSDGSVFRHIPNACTSLAAETPPEDMVAIVEHYATSV